MVFSTNISNDSSLSLSMNIVLELSGPDYNPQCSMLSDDKRMNGPCAGPKEGLRLISCW